MVVQRRQNKPQIRRVKGQKKSTAKNKMLIRATLVICVGFLLFIGIGLLKHGNIKKTNEQPKPFPVTVQN